MIATRQTRALLALPVAIALLGVAAYRTDDSQVSTSSSVRRELTAKTPQFHEVAGGYESSGSEANVEKSFVHRIAIQPNQTYVVTFQVDKLTGPVELYTDFIGANYDNPEQEFHLFLPPEMLPLTVTRRINSGPAPPKAYLRLFYYSPASIRVTNIRVSPYPEILGVIHTVCVGLAKLLALLFLGLLGFRGRNRVARAFTVARALFNDMTAPGNTHVLALLPILIGLLGIAAYTLNRIEPSLSPSVLGELSSRTPQFHPVTGGYESVSDDKTEKSLVHRVDIQPNREYIVSFQVDALTGPADLYADFIGPRYDNLEQEFHLNLRPDMLPLVVTRRIDSGPAPSEAYLRLFYYSPASIRISHIQTAPYPRTLSLAYRFCVGLAALLSLVFLKMNEVRGRNALLRALSAARAALKQHPLAVLLLGTFIINAGFCLRQFTSTQPFVLSDETTYAFQAKETNNPRALASNPLVSAPLPNTLYLNIYHGAFWFGDNYLQVARFLNGLFFSLALFPIYGVARKVTSAPLAVAAALAAVIGPASTYALFFMPEALYFLGFWAFIWCLFQRLHSHPLWAAISGGLALGALSLVKPHALQLLPITAVGFLVMALTERRLWPWERTIGQIALLFAGVALSRLALNLALSGSADIFSLGVYSSFTAKTVHVSGGWGALLFHHLLFLLSLYLLPVACLTACLFPGALSGLSGEDRGNRRFLFVLTPLILGTLMTTASQFTVAQAGKGIYETIDRLHGRYFNFAFPLLVICFLAAHPLLGAWSRARRWTFAAVLSALSAGALVAARLNLGATSFADYPDICWYVLSHAFRPYMAVLLMIAVGGLYLWRRSQSAVPFLLLFSGLAVFGNAQLSGFLAHISEPGPSDRAGQIFRGAIPGEQRDEGLIVSAKPSVDLYRMLFYLPGASAVLIHYEGIPLRPEDIPQGRQWVIACDTALEGVPVLRTVDSGYCKLHFLKQAASTDTVSAEPPPSDRPPGRIYHFQAGFSGQIAAVGFYPPEIWGSWAQIANPELRLKEPVQGKAAVIVSARVLQAGPNSRLSISLGGQTQTATLSTELKEYTLHFDLPTSAGTVTFGGIQPRSPASVGFGNDERPLGFAIAKFVVKPE
jgi:phosphoglycerol transferase